MVHVTIFMQIFKAGLARARHTPAESFLDTSMKTFSSSFFNYCPVFLFSSMERFCENEANFGKYEAYNLSHTRTTSAHFLTTTQS